MSGSSNAAGSQELSVDPSSSTGQLSINIDEVSTEMSKNIQECPKLLRKTAGERSCCIFRAPQSLIDINDKAYYPRIVSIGPYHHGNTHLTMIEEHKWKYLGAVDKRMQQNGHGRALGEFLEAIGKEEAKIRKCYSEAFESKFDSPPLAKMMVLDGIFIIELFLTVGGLVAMEPDDPVFRMDWVLPFIQMDLLGLENQIPFFVLQILSDKSAPSRVGRQSLTSLALGFFNLCVQRPKQVINKLPANLEGVHLLDLFRLSYIHSMATSDGTTLSALQPNINSSPGRNMISPTHQSSHQLVHSASSSISLSSTDQTIVSSSSGTSINATSSTLQMVSSGSSNMSSSSTHQSIVQPPSRTSTNTTSLALELLPSASKLRRAGIRFKVRKADSFLDINYSLGVLLIPQITIDEMTRAFMLNSVVFEQCYKRCSNHMTDYVNFMAGLVSTPSDVEILCDRGIIENYLVTHAEVTNLFTSARKDMPFDINGSYLSKVYKDVNLFRETRCWGWFPELWDTYFRSPWSLIKVFAGAAILGLTATQVYYAARSENDLPSHV